MAAGIQGSAPFKRDSFWRIFPGAIDPPSQPGLSECQERLIMTSTMTKPSHMQIKSHFYRKKSSGRPNSAAPSLIFGVAVRESDMEIDWTWPLRSFPSRGKDLCLCVQDPIIEALYEHEDGAKGPK